MMIYLLRHGDALDGARYDDAGRPLSQFGLRQASAVGSFLASNKSEISLAFCSPLVRARQTTEAVVRALGELPTRISDALHSSSDPKEILDELKTCGSNTVLLVGHEPHLSRTISLLLWGDGRSRVSMRTCSLACVSTPDPPEKGSGVLQWLVESKVQ
ncbi:MAG TPA: phosphohistidine phosphatase SixA [Bacteroidota bacterium]|nr:phosphohistidine phosphatase SixA [Bacteroidota bacterium]